MSDDTPHLGLPFLAESQQQKSVTVNEALNRLDAVVQLGVGSRALAVPPESPAEGDRYIVAAGAGGAWSGGEGRLAAFFDGAWTLFSPAAGWVAWVADERMLLVHDGTAWREFGAALAALQNLALIGVGTAADAANPFAAKLNAALWTAKAAAEGGNGDLRFTFNKEAAAATASLLFQDGYSGRAEIGLCGDDKFHVKMSPDGAAWIEALAVDASGNVGIGTTTPGGPLDLVSKSGLARFSFDSPTECRVLFSFGGVQTGIVNCAKSDNSLTIGTLKSGPIYFQAYGSNKLCLAASGRVGINTTSPNDQLDIAGNTVPHTDNAYSLGSSSARFAAIYAATGTINTSDARGKTAVADSPLGLAFIRALRPVAYKYVIGGIDVTEADDTPETVEEQATETVAVERTIVEIADGKAVRRLEQASEERPLYDEVPLVDASGAPVTVPGPDGAPMPATWRAPRMRKVQRLRKKQVETPRAGVRTHYGLLAQEVKAALDGAGIADFAGWTLADAADPDSEQGLRYDQFIAPLIRAVQELATKVEAQAAEIAALKGS